VPGRFNDCAFEAGKAALLAMSAITRLQTESSPPSDIASYKQAITDSLRDGSGVGFEDFFHNYRQEECAVEWNNSFAEANLKDKALKIVTDYKKNPNNILMTSEIYTAHDNGNVMLIDPSWVKNRTARFVDQFAIQSVINVDEKIPTLAEDVFYDAAASLADLNKSRDIVMVNIILGKKFKGTRDGHFTVYISVWDHSVSQTGYFYMDNLAAVETIREVRPSYAAYNSLVFENLLKFERRGPASPTIVLNDDLIDPNMEIDINHNVISITLGEDADFVRGAYWYREIAKKHNNTEWVVPGGNQFNDNEVSNVDQDNIVLIEGARISYKGQPFVNSNRACTLKHLFSWSDTAVTAVFVLKWDNRAIATSCVENNNYPIVCVRRADSDTDPTTTSHASSEDDCKSLVVALQTECAGVLMENCIHPTHGEVYIKFPDKMKSKSFAGMAVYGGGIAIDLVTRENFIIEPSSVAPLIYKYFKSGRLKESEPSIEDVTEREGQKWIRIVRGVDNKLVLTCSTSGPGQSVFDSDDELLSAIQTVVSKDEVDNYTVCVCIITAEWSISRARRRKDDRGVVLYSGLTLRDAQLNANKEITPKKIISYVKSPTIFFLLRGMYNTISSVVGFESGDDSSIVTNPEPTNGDAVGPVVDGDAVGSEVDGEADDSAVGPGVDGEAYGSAVGPGVDGDAVGSEAGGSPLVGTGTEADGSPSASGPTEQSRPIQPPVDQLSNTVLDRDTNVNRRYIFRKRDQTVRNMIGNSKVLLSNTTPIHAAGVGNSVKLDSALMLGTTDKRMRVDLIAVKMLVMSFKLYNHVRYKCKTLKQAIDSLDGLGAIFFPFRLYAAILDAINDCCDIPDPKLDLLPSRFFVMYDEEPIEIGNKWLETLRPSDIEIIMQNVKNDINALKRKFPIYVPHIALIQKIHTLQLKQGYQNTAPFQMIMAWIDRVELACDIIPDIL
jgi:hypothetical protein